MEGGCFLMIILTTSMLVQTIHGKVQDKKEVDKTKKPTASKRDLDVLSSKKTEKRGLDDLPKAEAFSYTYVVQNHGKLRKVIHVASAPEDTDEALPYGEEGVYHHDHGNTFHYSPAEYGDYGGGNQDGDYGVPVTDDGYSHNEFFPEGFSPDLFSSGEQNPYLGPVYVTAKPILASPEYRKAPVPSVPARLTYPLFTPYPVAADDGYSHPHQTKLTYPLHVGKTYVLPYNTRPFAHPPSPPEKSLVVYASPSPSYVISHDGESGLYNTLKFSPTVIPYTVHVNKNYVDFGRALPHMQPASGEIK